MSAPWVECDKCGSRFEEGDNVCFVLSAKVHYQKDAWGNVAFGPDGKPLLDHRYQPEVWGVHEECLPEFVGPPEGHEDLF